MNRYVNVNKFTEKAELILAGLVDIEGAFDSGTVMDELLCLLDHKGQNTGLCRRLSHSNPAKIYHL